MTKFHNNFSFSHDARTITFIAHILTNELNFILSVKTSKKYSLKNFSKY